MDGHGFPTCYCAVRSLLSAPLPKNLSTALCLHRATCLPHSTLHHVACLYRGICPPRLPPPRCPLAAVASTEPASLHDRCSSKQVRGGASCDTAPPVSCPRHTHTSGLHAPPPTSAVASSSAMTSLHSFKQQGEIALKAHVARLCLKCFRCFI
jgi:hypothetical protein